MLLASLQVSLRQRSSDPLAGFRGPQGREGTEREGEKEEDSLDREGKEKWRDGGKGKGGEKGGGREGTGLGGLTPLRQTDIM